MNNQQKAMAMVLAIGDAIRDVKQVPSGELYARLCDKLSLESFEKIIDILKNAGLIRVEAHLITWIEAAR